MTTIATATTLDELLAVLRSTDVSERDITRLPTFGGPEPRQPVPGAAWSWDETRVLVGTCRDDYRLVPRE